MDRQETINQITYHDRLQEGLKTFSHHLRIVGDFPENFFVELYLETPNSFGKLLSKIIQVRITTGSFPDFIDTTNLTDDEFYKAKSFNNTLRAYLLKIFKLFCVAAYQKSQGQNYRRELNAISGIMKAVLRAVRDNQKRGSLQDYLKNPEINLFRNFKDEIEKIESRFNINTQGNFTEA